MIEVIKIIGKRVRVIRKENKMSQQALGDKLGVGRDAITNIEIGRVEPKEWFIKLLSKEFNLSENWLINGVGEKYNILFNQYNDNLSSILVEYIENENITALSIIKKLKNLSDYNLDLVEKIVDEFAKK